jgi:hypothetical protein
MPLLGSWALFVRLPSRAPLAPRANRWGSGGTNQETRRRITVRWNERSTSERSKQVRRRLWFYGVFLVCVTSYVLWTTSMPGASFRGPLPPLTPAQRALAARLREHVTVLAGTIGERTVERPSQLRAARDYLVDQFGSFARDKTALVKLEPLGARGGNADNVIYELAGTEASVVIVGAHYDSAEGSPAANDNGSGVAALLELARHFSSAPTKRTLRFVAFANEEPPRFKNDGMGSLMHARNAQHRGDRVSAMLSLETLGIYSDAPGSQKYPWPVGLLYPDRGNFVAFVGNLASRSLVRSSIAAFREHTAFPSEGAALLASFPGIDWSDHWSFWQAGYPALMVTDTAVYRDATYHTRSDTPEHLNYEALARVVSGLEGVVRELAQ